MNLQLFAERDISKQKSSSLRKGIESYTAQIEEHKRRIETPIYHVPDWDEKSKREQEGLRRHWEKEIRNFQKAIEDRIAELKKRGDYDE